MFYMLQRLSYLYDELQRYSVIISDCLRLCFITVCWFYNQWPLRQTFL